MENNNKNNKKNNKSISVIDYGNTTLGDLNIEFVEKAESWEDFISLWMRAKEVEQIINFIRGDIANKICVKFGEQSLEKFANQVGIKVETIIALRRVARAFPPEKRGLNLTHTHYFLASQTDEFDKGEGRFITNNRYEWIKKANDNNWTTSRLAKEIKTTKELENPSTYFDYYEELLTNLYNIMLHLQKNKLNKLEKARMILKMNSLMHDFQFYFGFEWARPVTKFKELDGLISFLKFADSVRKNKEKLNIPGKKEYENPRPTIDFKLTEDNREWELLISNEDFKKIDWTSSVESMLKEYFGEEVYKEYLFEGKENEQN